MICPLIFVKSIKKLRHVALLAIASIFFFSIATIITFVNEEKYGFDGHKETVFFGIPDYFSFTSAMGELPVLFLAFGY